MSDGKQLARPTERRRSPRARDVGLRATILAGNDRRALVDVIDLSTGGALLSGELVLAAGEQVEVVLGIEGSHPSALVARVVRIEPAEVEGHIVAAVAFATVSDPIQDAIQRVVLRAIERRRAEATRTVLVIDDAPAICAALARDIRSLGYGAVTARRPLDALYCLEDPNLGIDAALVGTADGPDVLAYLAEEHPRVRRVVMSGVEQAVGCANAFLPKPWNREQLSNALHS